MHFYGDEHGARVFRKHLGWYVEEAPEPASARLRSAAKAQLCRLGTPREMEAALIALWRNRLLTPAVEIENASAPIELAA